MAPTQAATPLNVCELNAVLGRSVESRHQHSHQMTSPGVRRALCVLMSERVWSRAQVWLRSQLAACGREPEQRPAASCSRRATSPDGPANDSSRSPSQPALF